MVMLLIVTEFGHNRSKEYIDKEFNKV
ncbi:hypothetical protein Q0O39_14330, partial [Staphylococcus aureus]|nr:hypothetical protein [Staphylococcus aureus]